MEFLIDKVEMSDLKEIKNLAINNDGNQKLSELYLQHNYFNNPFKSKSFWKVKVNDKIEGFATSNNFKYIIDNKICMVAMPQNVLTSIKLRGKGLFNKLYNHTEIDNLESNKVDYFLTFTNELSTPIFLNKFGYLKGKCPNLLISFFNPSKFFAHKNYQIVKDLNSINFENIFRYNNSMFKSKDFFIWRYKLYDKNVFTVISIYKNKLVAGYAFFITEKKKGIKFLILSDIITYKEENISFIIDTCRVFITKKFFPMFIMFELQSKTTKNIFTHTLKDRFNFLIKGKSTQENNLLCNKKFNLFFSDTDFI